VGLRNQLNFQRAGLDATQADALVTAAAAAAGTDIITSKPALHRLTTFY